MQTALNYESQVDAERFEEMTDAAERLTAPMDHTMWFIDINGKLQCNSSTTGDDLLTICQKSVITAAEVAKNNPDWLLELNRRQLEAAEVVEASRLKSGENMLVLSPTPDDVLSGKMALGSGYNIHKKTIMLRYWSKIDERVSCRYVSLGSGNKAALREAVGRSIKFIIPDDSEEILAQRIILDSSEDYCGQIIDGYDKILSRKNGQPYSYGSRYISEDNALQIAGAERNQAVLDEHMAIVADIKQRFSGAKQFEKLETARQAYAARLDLAEQGKEFSSMSQAGDYADSIGADYSGSCPSAPENAQAAADQLFGEREVSGNCPYCGRRTSFKPCRPVCKICGSTPGNDRSKQYFEQLKESEKSKGKTGANKANRKPSLRETVSKRLRPKIANVGIFAVQWVWVDRKNRAVIDGAEANRIYYS
jgi:hypothetical protein